MTTSEKVAYLKGLAEGMGVQEDAGQGKLFKVIIDILEDLALDLADTKNSLVEIIDSVEAVGDELAELEDDFYDSACFTCEGCADKDDKEEDDDEDYDEDYDEDDDGDDEPVFYSVECPGCGFKLTVDEDILDQGSFECPECGEVIDLTSAEVEEVEFDDDEDAGESEETSF